MDVRPIPALYCCYLLRSTKSPSSLYVGSTPNPSRRLAQHNGHSKGGAVRTARENLRPWKMVCIVAGFMSNIAALQFEWAWQNSHLTRRITEQQRITVRKSINKVSKSGRVLRRPARPRMSLGDKLANLHLLLRVPSFARWPLEVHFFSKDVHQKWATCSGKATTKLPSGMRMILDFQGGEADEALPPNPGGSERSNSESLPKRGIEALDTSYASYKTHLDKSLFILADSESVHCVVCGKNMPTPSVMALVCPNDDCRAAFHVTCLASTFLRDEAQQNLLPTHGKCPSCKSHLQWTRLVAELSLRIRGSKEIMRLKKKPRRVKTKDPNEKTALGLSSMVEDDTDDDMNGSDQLDADGELSIADIVDEPLMDEARYYSDSDIDDTVSTSSVISDTPQFSELRNPGRRNSPASKLDTVIEDSDWDAAEVID